MKKKLFTGIALAASLFVSAADTDLTLQENWKLANIKKGCEAKFQKNEDGSLTLTTNSPVCYLTHRLQFNKEKMLRIEGTIESNDTYMVKLYFNDSSGRLIYTDQFHIVPETGTELAETTTGNETLLKVKDASKWKKGQSIAVGKGGELPNQHLYMARKGITAITPKEGYWEVSLKQPWGGKYPAGTALRKMFFNDGKLLINQYRLPVKTQTLSYTLQNEFTDKNEPNKWFQGAASAGLTIIMTGKSSEKSLKLTNLKIKEIEGNW